MKHLFAVLLFGLSASISQAQTACLSQTIEATVARFKANNYYVVANLAVLVAKDKSTPSTMVANPKTGEWFILVSDGDGRTCFPMAGNKLEPAK